MTENHFKKTGQYLHLNDGALSLWVDESVCPVGNCCSCGLNLILTYSVLGWNSEDVLGKWKDPSKIINIFEKVLCIYRNCTAAMNFGHIL
jgi:hypothetical protein